MKLYTWERWTLALILTGVGLLAGYVSIFHVATWTMDNSPPGTSIVAGLTNAAISELIPVAALIVYRICRRHDRSTKLAVFLIVAAGALSLSAQLAVAKVSLSGWVVSAAPMAAFMLLTKLVLALLAPTSDPSTLPVGQPLTFEPEGHSHVERTNGAEGSAAAWPESIAGPKAAGSLDCGVLPGPVAQAEHQPRGRRVRPRSLTSADKVQKAAKDLGSGAKPAVIAARAGVSESTARRYMPRPALSS